ncbi:MAG: Ldh family oxidoreductase [Gammaproteobacteria bacterium]|nr:Ldh family oxidoreductase [Gammaproteobacteria bacterium]NKB64988.1 Ldh family oxidoreductase [Gammaproteobacteria bacterium]
MSDVNLSLTEAHELAVRVLTQNGCDNQNAVAVSDTMIAAERDLCHSHGLFRLPGYVASLRSGKVNGNAKPKVEKLAPSVLRTDGNNGYAPLALKAARDPLAECAMETGIAAMSLINIHHFSALWVEIESLTEKGLCAMAFTAYTPSVAPAGGTRPFYGTNPMAFGWPRTNKPPMIFDQATATQARGEVMIAARDGHVLPAGVGIDAKGNPSTNPNEVLEGCLLPFGGYKGASIALMIELLVGPLIGERCSYEAESADNHDGGPPRGGEILIAMNPQRFGTQDPYAHAERLFTALLEMDGTRLPGDRRVQNRAKSAQNGIFVPQSLHDKIQSFL